MAFDGIFVEVRFAGVGVLEEMAIVFDEFVGEEIIDTVHYII